MHNSQLKYRIIYCALVFPYCAFFSILLLQLVSAQDYQHSNARKYWISFTDKNTTFDSASYFSERTIEQQFQKQLIQSDSSDFPVNKEYITEISHRVLEMRFCSRWLNGVAVIATEKQITGIKNLPFVRAVEQMQSPVSSPNGSDVCAGFQILHSNKEMNIHFTNLKSQEQKLLRFQLQRMQAEKFAERHIDGTGIRIAIFDAGFPNVDKHPAFAHLFKQHRIIATYDFVKNKENVFGENQHGTGTLSCITGMMDSVNIGMATGAEFLLARTEMSDREPFSEEENWLAAAEWAYRNGANIISCSLGYTNRRYFNTQMDGKTSLVARAANMAASKGMLVICAAGNEGDDNWHYIGTPADADSVIAVGGTNPYTDYKIDFSSFGPTSEGHLKPNVCAVGEAIVATARGYADEYGTSFSAPLVAGFAACVWQMHREWNNMKVFEEIEKSAHLYPYFDYAHGYGIPQAGYFTSTAALRQPFDELRVTAQGDMHEPTFDFVILNNNLKVILREKYAHPEEERMFGYDVIRNIYYRVDGSDQMVRQPFDRLRMTAHHDKVKFYAVVLAEQQEVLSFDTGQFRSGDKLTVHFEGYTNSYTIIGNEKP